MVWRRLVSKEQKEKYLTPLAQGKRMASSILVRSCLANLKQVVMQHHKEQLER
jgi:hypothetical protein